MKKISWLIFFLLISFYCYNLGFFSKIQNLMTSETLKTIYAEIPLNTIDVIIKNKDISKETKTISIYDMDNNCVFIKEVFLPDTNPLYSFYKGNNCVGFQLNFRESPYSRYIILDDSSPYYEEFILQDKWVSSSVICDHFILYSTEFSENTVKRIDINTGEKFSYQGFYPNVELFDAPNPNSLGIFKYENQWFNILENEIVAINETYDNFDKATFQRFLK